MKFIPILKTKRGDQNSIVEKVLCIFERNREIIPYIEVITIDSKRINDYKTKLENINYFIEYPSLAQYENHCSTNIIEVYKPKYFINDYSEIPLLIKEKHLYNRHIAFRINDGEKGMYNSLIKYLDEGDYIFIDIGNEEYPTRFTNDILIENRNKKCNVIIISDERDKGIRGEDFKFFGYNSTTDLRGLNYTVIEAIKAQSYPFEGFASYCSAKNDTTEGGGGNPVYGVFLIYNYDENQFFSVRSLNSNNIGVVYEDVNDHVKLEMTTIDALFDVQNISKKFLHDYILHPKNKQASKYKAISVIHYIETIDYYLYK